MDGTGRGTGSGVTALWAVRAGCVSRASARKLRIFTTGTLPRLCAAQYIDGRAGSIRDLCRVRDIPGVADETISEEMSLKINTAFYGKCHPWGHQELAVDPVRDRLRLHSKMTLTALADREILRLPKRLQPAINHFSLYFMKNLYLYFTG